MSVLYDDMRDRYALSLSSGLQILNSGRSSAPFNALLAGLSQAQEVEGIRFSALGNVQDELNAIQ